jgi:sterol desaturase/sphingolipid hydroxylase (fatty acid hydroxylase superfamily)
MKHLARDVSVRGIIMSEQLLAAGGGAVIGLVVGSFFEWWVHVLMHRRIVLGKVHTHHHKQGDADGFAWEFLYYAAGAVPGGAAVFGLAYLAGMPWLGAGLAVGGFIYAIFAAYAHQLQHERPELVFWMPRPIHHLHHTRQTWRANFGIGLDVWDRVFGTYQPGDWTPTPRSRPVSVRDFVRIQWW